MKTVFISALMVAASLGSFANAKSAYDRDSVSLTPCRGYNHKDPADCLVIKVMGSDTGVIKEIDAYLTKAGALETGSNGSKKLRGGRLEIGSFSDTMDIKIKSAEFVEMRAGTTTDSALGRINTVLFKGTTAKALLKAMVKAGASVEMHPTAYEVRGSLVKCSYTRNVWGHACELKLVSTAEGPFSP